MYTGEKMLEFRRLIRSWPLSICNVFFLAPLIMVSCGTTPPRRQYVKEAKQQVTPKEILNSEWTLESYDNKSPDCQLSMKFLDRGQFTIRFKDKLYDGDNLWYVLKDSVIEFHTRPMEKIAWTSDDCEMNPSVFALLLMGDKIVEFEDNKMSLDGTGEKRLVFKKI